MKKALCVIISVILIAFAKSSPATVHVGTINYTVHSGNYFDVDIDLDSYMDLRFQVISSTLDEVAIPLNNSTIETNGTDFYIIRMTINSLVGNQGWINSQAYFANAAGGNWQNLTAYYYAGFKLGNGCIGWVRVGLWDSSSEIELVDCGYSDTPGMLVRAGTYTEVIGMDELESKFSFRLFPNPATENISVCYSLAKASEVAITIYDETGHLVCSRANRGLSMGKQEDIFSVDELAGGIYFITLHIDDAIVKKPIEVIK